MARAFNPLENLFDSAKKAVAKFVAKSKQGKQNLTLGYPSE